MFVYLCIGTCSESTTAEEIRRMQDKLAFIIDPDYGLLEDLFEMHVLTGEECKSIREKLSTTERTTHLLNCITEKTQYQCERFLKALCLNQQVHVVNFILNKNGNRQFLYCSRR
jgi:Caspase recruitment domain